ncbi:sigma 54-interacting transcriptional regulator [Bacillus sp. FSL W7-1360]
MIDATPRYLDFLQTNVTIYHVNQDELHPHNLGHDVTFLTDGTSYFALESVYLKAFLQIQTSLNDIPWKRVETVAKDGLNTFLHRYESLTEYVLVFDKQKILGFIQIQALFPALACSYEHLKAYTDTILATTNSSISAINKDSRTTVWTKGAEKLFSIKSTDIIGKDMRTFFPESMLLNLDIMKTGQSVYQKQHEPREDLAVLINANPIRLHGKIIGAVASETDVTTQTQLTKALHSAKQTIHSLQQRVSSMQPVHDPFYHIKGASAALANTFEKIKQVGQTPARVLLLGESGVGKELFARALHHMRHPDPTAPFIAVNCGAIPHHLFESELFGYEKGAFSGASSQGKKGKFALANGGTLFLDEISELPLDMQVKLLRVLQEETYFAVGGTKQQQLHCHVIAATNQDLEKMIAKGLFREDLYFRLNIITINIPPLRERKEDIVALSHHFLFQYAQTYRKSIHVIPKEVMLALMDYAWPGNVRELQHTIERLVVFSTDNQLHLKDLSFSTVNTHQTLIGDTQSSAITIRPLKEALTDQERQSIQAALTHTNGNKEEAAHLLNISRATLYNKMNKLGILK